ncbi:MAG: D-alanine--D-alanine ligase [candidate division NC10 bacterium RIFCSPLOWO2_12_FULL_66_18]|nr:MAG: D-alanine--D-alanine ligase [candidate division NC10 bacterium RIFCSPLOWO2_02_FULL_66_22]OGB98309.1 MAG: D-alanine--D-alanine ligase [candidate division NC10 bacterium RIFCSPLOWO2_12_FULL_66_18]
MPRRQRILALVYEQLVPPENAGEAEAATAEWKTEYDVVSTLRALGHEVLPLGVGGDLGPIRKALEEFKPHIVFNLLEAFDLVPSWDHNVVAFLELMKVPYTGCNSRGLLLARDKALAKKLLSYHRIPVTDFAVFPMRRRVRRPRRLTFPLIVKSLTLDSSIGISQASVVETEEKLEERVRFIHESIGTDALVETYVEGRELYVGILGNQRLKVLPIWELLFTKMPEEQRKIATERLKWTLSYQRKRGIVSAEASDLPEGAAARIRDICKRVYRSLMLSGCARIDLRLSDTQGVYVMEANPNPELAKSEDFAQSAKAAGLEYTDLLQRIVTLGLRWEPTLPG